VPRLLGVVEPGKVRRRKERRRRRERLARVVARAMPWRRR